MFPLSTMKDFNRKGRKEKPQSAPRKALFQI